MKRALIIVDVQNDFLPPNGALAVPNGDEIIPIINRLIPKFECILATQDWHPSNHISFASRHKKKVGEKIELPGHEQILWPDHCIQNTFGAELSNHLNQSRIEKVFQKGTDSEIDSYSAFFDNARKHKTGLAEYLHRQGIKDLYFVGLATDYCVFYSVLDALDLGFRVNVIREGCRAVNLVRGDEQKALEKMLTAGAKLIEE